MGYSGSLQKMVITAYQDGDFTSRVGDPFTVMINPAGYSHNYSICYNDDQAQGSSGGSPRFNRIPSDTVQFELVFDGTGVVPTALPGVIPNLSDGITDQIQKLKTLVFTYNGKIHSPNFLQLAWGTLLFKCRLTSLEIEYTLFKPDGTPLRARAKASFQGYNDESELELQANKSSPDLTHVRTVKAGDTLPLMCYRIYGSSLPYLQVAAVNNLTDFRRLKVGSQIVFPPLDDSTP